MSMAAFTWVDWAVIGVLLMAALVGLGIGIVKMALMVGAWIGAALIALYGFAPLEPHVQQLLPVPVIARAATGLGLFVVSLIVLLIITQVISGLVENSALGAINRSLGLVFGVVLGFAMISVSFLLYDQLGAGEGPHVAAGERYPKDVMQAQTLPLLEFGRDAALAILPGGKFPMAVPSSLDTSAPAAAPAPVAAPPLSAAPLAVPPGQKPAPGPATLPPARK